MKPLLFKLRRDEVLLSNVELVYKKLEEALAECKNTKKDFVFEFKRQNVDVLEILKEGVFIFVLEHSNLHEQVNWCKVLTMNSIIGYIINGKMTSIIR